MSDQPITTEQMLEAIEGRWCDEACWDCEYFSPEMKAAIRAALTGYADMADRLAKAEAALEQARPLLEAVMAEGELSIVGKTSPAAHRLILAALAYREKQDKKEGE